MHVVARIVFPDGVGRVKSTKRVITSPKALYQCLEELCAFNSDFLRKDPRLPDIYDANIVYESEPPGQEDWLTYPVLIRLKAGDCLPLSTLVMREDLSLVPLGSLTVGTRIMGHGKWTTVTNAGVTGEKPILSMTLGNGSVLRCSPEHRLFTADGNEIRAEDVRPDHCLLTQNETSKPMHLCLPLVSERGWTMVWSIREEPKELCGDITTDQGRFWLPESDLVVHNCEDLACARVSKLRQWGELGAKPFLYHQKSSNLWHVMVLRGDGTVEDPSAVLGMYEVLSNGAVSGLPDRITRHNQQRLQLVAGIHSGLGLFTDDLEDEEDEY